MRVGKSSRSTGRSDRLQSGPSICRFLTTGMVIATLVLVSIGSDRASAQTSASSQNRLDPAQLLELFQWAARLTRRTLPDDLTLPVVVALSVEQLNQRVCPDKPTRCRPIAAAYGIENRDIIYRDSLDMTRLLDRSYLLHEVVHFLQHQDQRDAVNASCEQILANERQAYGVQAAFLRQHGIYQPVGLELRRIRCPRDPIRIARQQQSESTVR